MAAQSCRVVDPADPLAQTWEEHQRRMQNRGEYKGLAWIVLAHAPTTDAYIYLYVAARSIHLHSFLINSQPGQLHHQPKLRNEIGCRDMFLGIALDGIQEMVASCTGTAGVSDFLDSHACRKHRAVLSTDFLCCGC